MRFGSFKRLILFPVFVLLTAAAFAQSGVPPVYLKFEHDKIFIINDEKVAVTADLYIGTEQMPVQNIYALSLDIAFPPDLIIPDSTSFTYHPPSFLGNEEEITLLRKSDPQLAKGRMDITIGRTDGKDVSGFGKIGTYRFITTHDIIGSRLGDNAEVLFDIELLRIDARNAAGESVPLEVDEEGSSVMIILDRLANRLRLNDRRVDVYPNPANDVLYVSTQNLRTETIEVFNAFGQRVYLMPLRTNMLQLATANYQPGVYFLKIHAEEGMVTRRFVIRR